MYFVLSRVNWNLEGSELCLHQWLLIFGPRIIFDLILQSQSSIKQPPDGLFSALQMHHKALQV